MIRAKIDDAQTGVVMELRSAGAKVHSLAAAGRGVPDLIVFMPTADPELIIQTAERLGGVYLLVEVKTGNGRLTARQELWHESWGRRAIDIVRSAADALRLIGR